MDNCILTARKFLSLLNIKYTDKSLRENLLSHPDYPSLLSISEILVKYNIENVATKTSFERLQDFPQPSIIQIVNEGNSFFYVLESFSKDEVRCYDESGELKSISINVFQSLWTGICLIARKTEQSGEEGIKNRLEENKTIYGTTMACGLFLLLWTVISFSNSDISKGTLLLTSFLFYFILKIVGFLVSLLFLWWEIDHSNPGLQKFCAGGKKMDCSAVMTSRHSKVLGEFFSLNVVVCAYFFSSTSFLLISGFSKTSLALLSYCSMSTVPLLLISIYYQLFVIKKWCKLCIIIKAVLGLEILMIILGRFYSTPVEMSSIPLLLFLFLLPILGWKFLKGLLKSDREFTFYKKKLRKLKSNPDILRILLLKSRRLLSSSEGLGIEIKTETAKYQVLKVSNLYCNPCAKAHLVLEKLVNEGKINLQIIFSGTTSSTGEGLNAIKHFLSIDAKGDKTETRKALDHWFGAKEKNYSKFAVDFPVTGELQQDSSKIRAMVEWCETEKIYQTPTIFINGHELPEDYDVEDLSEILI